MMKPAPTRPSTRLVVGSTKKKEIMESSPRNIAKTRMIVKLIVRLREPSPGVVSSPAKKCKIQIMELRYLPFWLVPLKATSHYEGVLERISPPSPRTGTIDNDYDWLVLGRKGTVFPTRDYSVPVEGKIPFDFTKVDPQGVFLNSEIASAEAIQHAKDEVEEHQRFLVKQDVDQVTKFTTEFNVSTPTYIHAPLWFATYEYKGRSYNAILDGSSGQVLRGDVPPVDFKMI